MCEWSVGFEVVCADVLQMPPTPPPAHALHARRTAVALIAARSMGADGLHGMVGTRCPQSCSLSPTRLLVECTRLPALPLGHAQHHCACGCCCPTALHALPCGLHGLRGHIWLQALGLGIAWACNLACAPAQPPGPTCMPIASLRGEVSPMPLHTHRPSTHTML